MDFRRSAQDGQSAFQPEGRVAVDGATRTERSGVHSSTGPLTGRCAATKKRMHKQDAGSPAPETRPFLGRSPAVYRFASHIGRREQAGFQGDRQHSPARKLPPFEGRRTARATKTRSANRATRAHTRPFWEAA